MPKKQIKKQPKKPLKKATKKSSRKATTSRPFKLWPWPILLSIVILLALVTLYIIYIGSQASGLDSFTAKPFITVKPLVRPNVSPKTTISPTTVKNAYKLGSGNAGSGTIAIIDSYDAPTAEADLNTFSTQFGLRGCTTANGCFEKHKMASSIAVSTDWAVEASLDTQWAHAIAPGAKILLIEAKSANGNDLVNAIAYARSRSDVVAVSMSWGGGEFSSEGQYEQYFTSPFGATFFASSGDSGHGVSWPATSANVIGVGGTTLNLAANGSVVSEVAWEGSGGGVSSFIGAPASQRSYNVPQAGGRRAVPDVAYDADPNTGFAVYDSTPYAGHAGWFQVGGTSAGAPQWAAMRAISPSVTAATLYKDGAKAGQTVLRDITAGRNGACVFYCTAAKGYDYVTGLGSPLTTAF